MIINSTLSLPPENQEVDLFEWLPCSIREARECDRESYFQVEDDIDTCTTHLRGRQLKGDTYT
jgi:hypothetical protein